MAGRKYNKELSVKRLNEIFNGEPQRATASRLHTTQGNVSKWKSGEAKPTTEFLLDISTVYEVSIDWILGLTDNKKTTDIDIEALTYEQVIKVLDRLLEYNSLVIPNLYEVGEDKPEEELYGDEEQDDSEVISKPELYNPDYMKCNDRILSYFLWKRIKCMAVDADTYVSWAERNHHIFNETGIADCRRNINEALNQTPNSASLDTNGWKERIDELRTLTEEEIQKLINNKKEGLNNG